MNEKMAKTIFVGGIVAGGVGVVLIIVFGTLLAFRQTSTRRQTADIARKEQRPDNAATGEHQPDNAASATCPELIGTWKCDLEATESFPDNQHVTEKEMDETIRFQAGLQQRTLFTLDGRYFMWDQGNPDHKNTTWTYAIVSRDGDTVVISIRLRTDTYDSGPMESTYRIIDRDRVALLNSESPPCWLVLRRESQGLERDGTVDDEWERSKREALSSPPIEWFCAKTESEEQRDDFWKWQSRKPGLVPEARSTVLEWLEGEASELDKVVTNKPTGAQYRIVGNTDAEGVRCSVKFVGNTNWK